MGQNGTRPVVERDKVVPATQLQRIVIPPERPKPAPPNLANPIYVGEFGLKVAYFEDYFKWQQALADWRAYMKNRQALIEKQQLRDQLLQQLQQDQIARAQQEKKMKAQQNGYARPQGW